MLSSFTVAHRVAVVFNSAGRPLHGNLVAERTLAERQGVQFSAVQRKDPLKKQSTKAYQNAFRPALVAAENAGDSLSYVMVTPRRSGPDFLRAFHRMAAKAKNPGTIKSCSLLVHDGSSDQRDSSPSDPVLISAEEIKELQLNDDISDLARLPNQIGNNRTAKKFVDHDSALIRLAKTTGKISVTNTDIEQQFSNQGQLLVWLEKAIQLNKDPA